MQVGSRPHLIYLSTNKPTTGNPKTSPKKSTSKNYFQYQERGSNESTSPENGSVGEGSLFGASPVPSCITGEERRLNTLPKENEPYYFSLAPLPDDDSSGQRSATPPAHSSSFGTFDRGVLRTPSPLSTPSVTPKSTPSKSAPSSPLKKPQPVEVPLSFAEILMQDIEGTKRIQTKFKPMSHQRLQKPSKNSTTESIIRVLLPIIERTLKNYNVELTKQRINAILDMLEKIENKKKLLKKEYEGSIKIIRRIKDAPTNKIDLVKLEQEEKRSCQIYLDTLRHFKDKIINELCNTDPELKPEAVKSILEAADVRHMENI